MNTVNNPDTRSTCLFGPPRGSYGGGTYIYECPAVTLTNGKVTRKCCMPDGYRQPPGVIGNMDEDDWQVTIQFGGCNKPETSI